MKTMIRRFSLDKIASVHRKKTITHLIENKIRVLSCALEELLETLGINLVVVVLEASLHVLPVVLPGVPVQNKGTYPSS